jgi:hypothetical protein
MSRSLLIVCVIVLSCHFVSGKPEGKKRILFLGSSSTYAHEMPNQVSEWLNQYAGWNSNAELMGKSGTGFQDYLRPGFKAQYGLKEGQTLLEKIRDEKFDYVVVQQITYFMADKDSSQIIEDTHTICNAIKSSGAKVVFYEMGWRLPEMNETGRQMILREAGKNQVRLYAPCSSAWAMVRSERPDIELHNLPDTDHPGTLGTYLNLCCFYAVMTGKSPVGLPPKVKYWFPFGASDKDKMIARKKLATANLDKYQKAMPEFMQLMSIMGGEKTIDVETARYLQKTAWKVSKGISHILKTKQ